MTGKIDQASLQSILYKIGYFIFVAVFLLAILLSLRIALFYRDHVRLSSLTVSPTILFHTSKIANHRQIVKWLLLASPFLALRAAYGILGIFEAIGAQMFTSMWSPLFGSAIAFALMGLLPEYIIVCIYIHVLRFRVKSSKKMKLLLSEGRDSHSHEMGRHGRR